MNEFYTYGDTLIGGTTANAEDVAAEFNAIVSGLDKLPTEAQLKSGQLNYAVDTGAANAYVVTMPQVPLSLYDGYTIQFKAANANTTSSTINVNGLGAKSLVNTDGSVLQSGDIVAGAIVTAVYDGTKFQVTNTVQGVMSTAVAAKNDAVIAQGFAEDAQAAAETAQGLAEDANTYAAEWANKAEDSPVSIAAGGDGSTTFSALHWAAKAEADASIYKLLTTTSLSGESQVDLTLTAGYSKYIINFNHVACSASAILRCRTSTDGGATFDSGANDYYMTRHEISTVPTHTTAGLTTGTDRIELTGSGDSFTGSIELFAPSEASASKMIANLIYKHPTGAHYVHTLSSGGRHAASDVDAIRFYPSTGNFAAGTIKLYGVV